MNRFAAQAIDRAVIRMAAAVFHKCPDLDPRVEQARAGLEADDFLAEGVDLLAEPEFTGKHSFSCASPVEPATPECQRIYGRFYRCGSDWRERPVSLVLHGWNGENCRRWLFPLLGRAANRRRYSLMYFHLPVHGRRRPRVARAEADFISPDLDRTVRATRQAIADTRALIGWLHQQGCPRIGIWGISLGAWIAGLVACNDRRLASATLIVPIPRMDYAIENLPFCAPISRSIASAKIPFYRLSLLEQQPVVPKEHIRIFAGRHDLFTPRQSVHELWEAWGRPQIEWTEHGHISILLSRAVMKQVLADPALNGT